MMPLSNAIARRRTSYAFEGRTLPIAPSSSVSGDSRNSSCRVVSPPEEPPAPSMGTPFGITSVRSANLPLTTKWSRREAETQTGCTQCLERRRHLTAVSRPSLGISGCPWKVHTTGTPVPASAIDAYTLEAKRWVCTRWISRSATSRRRTPCVAVVEGSARSVHDPDRTHPADRSIRPVASARPGSSPSRGLEKPSYEVEEDGFRSAGSPRVDEMEYTVAIGGQAGRG